MYIVIRISYKNT